MGLGGSDKTSMSEEAVLYSGDRIGGRICGLLGHRESLKLIVVRS